MTEISTPSSFLDFPTADFLERIAAAKLTPGAGSAAALLGAVAGSLVQAAAKYAIKSRKSGAEAPFRERATVLLAEAQERTDRLRQAVDEDAAAFEVYWRLLTELRAVSSDDATRSDLQARATDALRQATDVPIEIARQGAALAAIGLELYERGHRNARGEAATAVLAAIAGAEAAVHTARLNLQSQGEAPWAVGRGAEIRALRGEFLDLRRRIETIVYAEEPAAGGLG
jgi:formiminotetrahydrofolate cyclodeaminase